MANVLGRVSSAAKRRSQRFELLCSFYVVRSVNQLVPAVVVNEVISGQWPKGV